MKKNLLTSAFAFCLIGSLGIQQAHGMMDHEDLPDLPENSKICCLMALAAYGDDHDGSKAACLSLEEKGFICDAGNDNLDLALGMKLWRHTDETKPFIAIRGTIPSLENILADGAVIKYAIDTTEPYNYIDKFLKKIIKNWEEEKRINNNIDSFLKYLPTDTTVHRVKTTGGSLLGGLGMWGLSSLALGPLGAGIIAGTTTYATYQLLGGYYPETKAINALIATSQAALTTANKWADSYDHSVILTGHSLGGFLTNTVAELSTKKPNAVLTFNAPGGAARFITAQKKYILGEQDDRITWVKKSLNGSEENFPHVFRKNTNNIARTNGLITCFGGDDASRTSIFIKDYYNQEKCPMGVIEYLMENHAIFNLAKDFGVLKIEQH